MSRLSSAVAEAAGPAAPAASDPPAESPADTAAANEFRVSLDNFDGPFDLLLTLISQHELDITEVSLSLVTDEFISYLARSEQHSVADLDRASEFLVVAATLLDMKIVSLLPQGEAVDAEDIALLEARDLLFARLLQYRAFKRASEWIGQRLRAEAERHPRQVPLDAKYRGQGPELVWTLTPGDFAALAAVTLAPREVPTVGLEHLHAPLVSIREQAAIVVSMLRSAGQRTFRDMVAGIVEAGVVVARFLALLELYRRQAVSFEQHTPLGDLHVRWAGEHWSDDDLANLGTDYDS